MSIKITDRAKEELTRLGVGNSHFLRISVIPGGCSGHTYSAVIDDALRENDQVVYEAGPFKALADLDSSMYLDGLEIDYSEDLIQSGFRFRNPNAAKACGCGASFQL